MADNTSFPQNDYFEQFYAVAQLTDIAKADWDPINNLIAVVASTPGTAFPFAITEDAAKKLVVTLQYLLDNKPELSRQ